jgi:hypothetical protein
MRLFLAVCLLAPAAGAATYYVDCASGSDGASGVTQSTAWKSVDKVSATIFAPGDSILLHRGTRCEGLLWPKGSGQDGRPIRIGAYGEGALPVVHSSTAEAALKLFDQQGWEIENLETSGGNPYGVFIGASPRNGTLKHFVLRNLVVHDVSGAVKKKSSGLVVLTTPDGSNLEDILVDGVTASRTSQWAGISISGPADNRARNVVVRNSIVHDVQGDGIVLMRAENGVIEKSAAWHTGLQERETIGTPNGIWTWTCRNCVVQNTEGFWIDSPSVDGGVYDIDWGNEDNVVQYNYGHDAQGYCLAAFGAGKLVTTNSTLRYNVCVNNGRSPKLARRQGDVYTATWDGGFLDGLIIEGNTIVWNPPIDEPALRMTETNFTGTRPNIVRGNIVYSSVASLVRAASPVKFEGNVYWTAGGPATWSYAGQDYKGIAEWCDLSPRDSLANPGFDWLLRPQKAVAGTGATSNYKPPTAAVKAPASLGHPKDAWLLLLIAGNADGEARSQLVFVQTALAQYQGRGLTAAVAAEAGANLAYDWNFGAVRRMEIDRAVGAGKTPALVLVSPAGDIVRRWDGFAPPADLGLTLKHFLGSAPGNPRIEIE